LVLVAGSVHSMGYRQVNGAVLGAPLGHLLVWEQLYQYPRAQMHAVTEEK
jgi:hypothetical protein